MTDDSSSGPAVLYVDPNADRRDTARRGLAETLPEASVSTADAAGTARDHVAENDVDVAVSAEDVDGTDGVELLGSLSETSNLTTVLLVERGSSPDGGPDEVVHATDQPGRAVGYAIAVSQSGVDPPSRDRRLEALARSTVDVVLTVDGTGAVCDVNPAVEEVLGYRPGEVLGRSLSALLVGDDADRWLQTGDSPGNPFETTVRHRDGHEVVLEFSLTEFRDEGDRYVTGIGRDVTERKNRQRQVRRNRDLLEEIQEITSVGGWEVDLTTDPSEILWTGEVYRIHGLDADEPLALEDAIEFYHPEDRDRVRAAVEDAVEDGEPYEFEARLVTADGDQRWIQSIGKPIREDGEVVRLRGSIQDVTDRKRRERRLQERERELERYTEFTEDVLDAVDDLVYVLDPDGSLRQWNDSLPALTGYSDDEIGSMTAAEFIVERDREAVAEAMDDAFETGRARIEAGLLTESGESIPYEFVGGKVEDPDGETVLVGIGRDVSDRRERERRLRRERNRFQTLVDNLPGMVYRCRNDPDWPMEFVGGQCVEVTGYTADELEANEVVWGEEVIVPEDREMAWDVVQDALDEREPFELTYRIETPDGERRWMWERGQGIYDDGELEALEGYITDVTDRKEREEELREREERIRRERNRFETLVGNLPGMVYRCDNEPGWPMEFVSEGCLDLTGHDPEAVENDEVLWGEDVIHPEDREAVWEDVQAALDEREPFKLTYRILRADGTQRWVWEQGQGIYDDDELEALEGYITDVTDQKRRERQLETLNEVSQELSTAEDGDEICDLAVRAVRETLEGGVASVRLYDEDTGTLAVRARHGEDGDGPLLDSGGDLLWDVYLDGEAHTGADHPDLASGLESAVVLPLGKHGVLAVGTRNGTFSEGDVGVVRLLEAHLEVALDRLDREDDLRDHAERLQEQTEQLERLDRVNRVIREITGALLRADSRDEIESTVCTKLVGVDPYQFAWIGRRESVGGGVVAHTSAGVGDLEDVAGDGGGPIERAMETGETQVHEDLRSDPPFEPWRVPALRRGYRSMVVVPLNYRNTRYGVLCVYAEEGSVFDEMEAAVLSELGETVGYAINAVESKRALVGDTAVELEFTLTDDDLEAIWGSRELDATYEFETIVEQTDGSLRLFFVVEGATPEEVDETTAGMQAVTDVRAIGPKGDGHLFEATLTGASFTQQLVEYGARPTGMNATGEGARVTVELPRSADVGAFVEMFLDENEGAQLVARRELDRPIRTEAEFGAVYKERLTSRQEEVVETAYYSGFFESPRETTGAEVAEMLDVSQPTVNRHVREAERKLFELVFEDDVE